MELLLNLNKINEDRIKNCITINQVIDCSAMYLVTYTIAGQVYSIDLYYNKPYAKDINLLLHKLRTGVIKA